jgi:hypothetical protein
MQIAKNENPHSGNIQKEQLSIDDVIRNSQNEASRRKWMGKENRSRARKRRQIGASSNFLAIVNKIVALCRPMRLSCARKQCNKKIFSSALTKHSTEELRL